MVLRLDPHARTIWEPACGQGHMAEPLSEFFPVVLASDIYDHGFGSVVDFLDPRALPLGWQYPEWVVTNPPFDHAEEFVRRGLEVASKGVAVLCRIAFLEGGERYDLLARAYTPLTLCCVFSERVSMCLGVWDPKASLPSCYAWFFFQKAATPMPIKWFPPGTEARLHRREDVIRFGKKTPAPLFGE